MAHFELVLEFLEFFPITADINIFRIIRDLLFYLENVCCVYSLESPHSNKYIQHTFDFEENGQDDHAMFLDLAL